jgi:hypothetical protein
LEILAYPDLAIRTARNDHEETQSEDARYTELLLQLHLQPGDHGDGQANDEYVCGDVEANSDPVVDLRGFGTALICAWLESTVRMHVGQSLLTVWVIGPALVVGVALKDDVEKYDEVGDYQSSKSEVVHNDQA